MLQGLTFLLSARAFFVTKRVWGMGPSTESTSSSTPAGHNTVTHCWTCGPIVI
jgi:hypothetical protein